MPPLRNSLIAVLLLFASVSPVHAADDKPKWIRVSSGHFNVLTDADEKKGTQTILRMEQMRAIIGNLLMKSKLHLSEPLDIIAVKSDEEYVQIAPIRDGRPIGTSGFFLPGDDRNYIVLDLADEKSWQTVAHDFAHLFLNYNYPPTQSWFDEGLAEYFSSVQLGDQQGELGADPRSYIPLLLAQKWLPLPELFQMRVDASLGKSDHGKALFRAESWIVMHYLITQDKLSETGGYFGAVQLQGLPTEEAIQKAYGVSTQQLEQAVKDHLQSLVTPAARTTDAKTKTPPSGPGITRFTPVSPLDIGTSLKPVLLPEARALITEMMVRLHEHREAALKEIDGLMAATQSENPIEHRTMAWVYLEEGKPNDAVEELKHAIDLSEQDPWAHYYYARYKYRTALANGSEFPGLANMLLDLRIVLDWNQDFAEALNMLAMGRAEGGGVNSAVEVIRTATELSPRNETYVLNMALVNMAAKKWEAATALLDHLKASHDPKIASAAKNYIDQLPNARKYGVPPKRALDSGAANATAKQQASVEAEDPDEVAQRKRVEPPPDLRKTLFAKGKLLRINCSQTPVAILTVTSGSKTLHLRTENYHSLLLIGSDEFSCDWEGLPVTVNYKAGGKSDGDLVSLEIADIR